MRSLPLAPPTTLIWLVFIHLTKRLGQRRETKWRHAFHTWTAHNIIIQEIFESVNAKSYFLITSICTFCDRFCCLQALVNRKKKVFRETIIFKDNGRAGQDLNSWSVSGKCRIKCIINSPRILSYSPVNSRNREIHFWSHCSVRAVSLSTVSACVNMYVYVRLGQVHVHEWMVRSFWKTFAGRKVNRNYM